MVTLKLQYDTFESGEFTEEQTVDTNTLLTIFEEHTQIVKTRRSYTINKPYVKFFIQNGENYLQIMHFAKDVFSVEYCNDPDNKLYAGNFYKKSIITIIQLFSESNFNALNKAIPRTKIDESILINSFIREDFTYEYKYRGLAWLIIHALINLPILALMIVFIKNRPFDGLNVFLILILLFFPIQFITHFLLNINYVQKTKGRKIKISSGSSKITYTHESEIKVFEKSDIKELIVFEASFFRNPHSDYSYTRIILNDNYVIDISYMIIEPYILQLKMTRIPSKTISQYYPYIRNYCP